MTRTVHGIAGVVVSMKVGVIGVTRRAVSFLALTRNLQMILREIPNQVWYDTGGDLYDSGGDWYYWSVSWYDRIASSYEIGGCYETVVCTIWCVG